MPSKASINPKLRISLEEAFKSLWQPMLKGKIRVAQYDNSRNSALSIIDMFMPEGKHLSDHALMAKVNDSSDHEPSDHETSDHEPEVKVKKSSDHKVFDRIKGGVSRMFRKQPSNPELIHLST